jgi:dolichol-phosphate mannosyltransferase
MELKRFAHKVDLFYQTVKLSKKTVEVPIHFAERVKETSKFSLKEVYTTYKVVLLIRLRESVRFLKFGAVGFIGFLVNAIGIEVFRRLVFTEGLAAVFTSLSGVWGLGVMTEPSSWAAALGAELSIISNFTLNNVWTFKEKKITEPGKLVGKFLTFNLTSLGAIVIQFAVIGAAVGMFGDTALVRQLALVAAIGFLIIPYNYTMYNLFIWKTWRLPWQKKG